MNWPSIDVPKLDLIQPPITADRFPDLKIDMPFTYDDIVWLLEEVERDDFEERYTHEQIVEIAHFLIQLARIGAFLDEDLDELEADIQDLLSSLDEEPDFVFAPSMTPSHMFADSHCAHRHVVLCKKGFVHRCMDHTKHFCHKNKKVILISVAVVLVAVVIVAVVASAPASVPAALAAGGAGAAGAASDNKPSNHEEDSLTPPVVEDAAAIQSIISEQVISAKEVMAVTSIPKPIQNTSIINGTRELGSSLAHHVLDGVGDMVSIIPQGLNEINEVASAGAKFLPEWLQNHGNNLPAIGNPIEKLEKIMAQGHQAIDQIFDTDQACMFTPEAKESKFKMAVGIIPPPWIPGNPATRASNVKGWKVREDITNLTKAGNVPSWYAVRARYWKEEALSNPGDYTAEQVERMKSGLAPQQLNPKTGKMESMELHHDPAQRDGGLFDVIKVWPEEHAELDPSRYTGE